MQEFQEKLRSKPLQIILVEDDDGDAKAVKRAFLQAKIANPIIRAVDGVEALSLLRGEGEFVLNKPYVLLVDLNMPRMGGIELIRNIREDVDLCQTVIFVLSTSSSEEDKSAAYDLNVAGYILKETAGQDFLELSDMLDNYWKIVELPE